MPEASEHSSTQPEHERSKTKKTACQKIVKLLSGICCVVVVISDLSVLAGILAGFGIVRATQLTDPIMNAIFGLSLVSITNIDALNQMVGFVFAILYEMKWVLRIYILIAMIVFGMRYSIIFSEPVSRMDRAPFLGRQWRNGHTPFDQIHEDAELYRFRSPALRQNSSLHSFEITLHCCGLHGPFEYIDADLPIPLSCYREHARRRILHDTVDKPDSAENRTVHKHLSEPGDLVMPAVSPMEQRVNGTKLVLSEGVPLEDQANGSHIAGIGTQTTGNGAQAAEGNGAQSLGNGTQTSGHGSPASVNGSQDDGNGSGWNGVTGSPEELRPSSFMNFIGDIHFDGCWHNVAWLWEGSKLVRDGTTTAMIWSGLTLVFTIAWTELWCDGLVTGLHVKIS